MQIYKPTHSTNAASAALLVHTPTDSPDKCSQPKSNQHQLAPIDPPQEQQNRSGGDFNSGKRGRDNDRSNRGCGGYGNSDNRYENQDRGGGRGQGRREYNENRRRGQENFSRGRRRPWDNNDSNDRDLDNRDRPNEGQNNSNRGSRWDGKRGQNDGDRGRGRRWNQHNQYSPQEYSQNYPPSNHYWPPPMGCQYQYQMPYEQYPPYPQQQQYAQRTPAQSRQAVNICQLCQNQGHYDYQCQFAGDFMARTQKAFIQGRSYNHC